VIEYIKKNKGHYMDYDIIYSKRKTISLVIKDEKLVVRAPIGTRKSKIKKIVEEHSLWIEKGMEKSRERAKKNDISPEEEKELRKLAKKRHKASIPNPNLRVAKTFIHIGALRHFFNAFHVLACKLPGFKIKALIFGKLFANGYGDIFFPFRSVEIFIHNRKLLITVSKPCKIFL
jgi:hypothetical protein